MKYYLMLLSVVVFGLGAKAQVNIDSLLKIWNNEKAADTVRLKAIGIMAEEEYLYSKPDTAIYLLQLQYDFAESRGLKIYMGEALNRQAFSYLIKSNYIKSLEYFQRCLKVQTEIENQLGMSGALNGVGTIYASLGNHNKALEYYNRILELNESIGNQRVIAGTTINMAACYLELGEYDKALSICNRGIQISEENGYKRFIGNGLEFRGQIFLETGKYDQAKADFERVLKIFEEMGDNSGISESLGHFGTYFNLIGEYRDAIIHCDKSLGMAVEVGSLRLQKTACQCLYDAYKALSIDDKALDYHERLLSIVDEMQKEDASQKLQLMEFEKKELIAEQKHENEVRKENMTKNIFLGFGLLLLLIAAGLFNRNRYINRSKKIIEKERDRSDNLLLNILPADIAEELKTKGKADARDFEIVSILFTDFKGFTSASEKMSAKDLVASINQCFEAFDAICEKYQVEKIKTIGDAYMAAGGLPIPSDDSVKNTVLAALEMQHFITQLHIEKEAKGEHAFQMRVGINTGPVVAGIVGVKKFQYDIWGDTVNTASRIESNGEIGKVNISQATYELLKDNAELKFESRGKIKAKGKGEIEMYFVSLKE